MGAENIARDVVGLRDSELGYELPGHLILLVRGDIYMTESLHLEELTAAGHHRFPLACAPLKLGGATGPPVGPPAITYAE